MVNYICTRFKDSDGLDLGCHLIPKEYLLEKYPALQEWVKAPGLWAWGRNTGGQLGNGNTTSTSSPVQTVATSLNWRSVSVGSCHAAAIKTDGTLWLWGYNCIGQLGNNSILPTSSPVQTICGGTNWRIVSAGGQHTAAIKTDGTLWLWGQGVYGQLGNNVSNTNRASPVQTVSTTNNWGKVSSGGQFTSAIKTDGTLWTWGRGAGGRLGNSSVIDRSSPVQTASAVTTWKETSSGFYNTAAIKTDGTLWVWGVGTYGQLGNNTAGFASSPIQTVSNVTTWKQVSTGFAHITAIKTDGSLWTWGFNISGQLGNNSAIHRSSPVQTVSGGTNWREVKTGYYHTIAIKTDGSLWTWGRANLGQLGDSTVVNKSSPVQTVSGGTNWRIAGGGGMYHTAAIRDEGDF